MLSALLKSSESAKLRPPQVSSSDGLEGNTLFEAFVCEFHWAALQIGAIACCMNSTLASKRSWTLRACTNLVPIESPVVKVAVRSWLETGLPRGQVDTFRRIYLDLADAKKLALPLIDSASNFVAPQVPLAKLEQIAALWRKLAEDCRNALLELEPETRWRLNGAYTGNALVLSKFLREALEGSRACVNHYGEVALPILPMRRRTPRYVFQQPCKILSKGGTSVALAHHISKIDLGIHCKCDLRLKDPITIELRSGRKIDGLVVWRKDDRAGVRFDHSLADSDPLLFR